MKQGFPFATAGQRVGLLGGSFDPAHEGHVLLTEEALKRFGLDRVWWLVTPGNPLKAHQPAPLAERIAHAQKLMDDPRVEVTGIEAELGTQKTVDTIAALQKHYPNLHFTWLMGSDNLAQFSRWKNWRAIARMMPIAVIARPGYDALAFASPAMVWLRRYRLPVASFRNRVRWSAPALVTLRFDPDKRSATEIRKADPHWAGAFAGRHLRDGLTHHPIPETAA